MKVQRGSSPIKAIAIFLIVLAAVLPMSETKADNWYEEEPGFFTLFDEEGGRLTVMASEMFKDDEYISSDNRHYSIYRVDMETRNAYAKFIGEIELPQFEEVGIHPSRLLPKRTGKEAFYYIAPTAMNLCPQRWKISIPSQEVYTMLQKVLRDPLKRKV